MSDNPRPAPTLSVIIPAYNSHDTIRQCMEHFQQQTASDFEVIVVDSGSSDAAETMIRAEFPGVNFQRSTQRLYPHEARNTGARYARGEVLVFTDPDAYPDPDWLEKLCDAYRTTASPIISAVACYGDGWWENGLHFAKFDKWLPGGPSRPIDIGPTVGFLCPRTWFDELGGFPDNPMLGDTVFSWMLTEHGHPLWFAHEVVTYHHHIQTWRDFIRERYTRGREFGELRTQRSAWSVGRLLMWIAVSLLPIRLIKLLWRGFENARRANLSGAYLWTLPISIQGQGFWLLGEVHAYLNRLLRP